MKYEHKFDIEVKRETADALALSAKAIDDLRDQLCMEVLRAELLDANKAGITLPRKVRLTGVIEIEGGE